MCSLQIRGEPFQERMATCKTWLMLWWNCVLEGAKLNVRNLFGRYEPNICFFRETEEPHKKRSQPSRMRLSELRGWWKQKYRRRKATDTWQCYCSTRLVVPVSFLPAPAPMVLTGRCCRRKAPDSGCSAAAEKNVLPDANLQLQCCPGPGFWWQEKELEAKQMDRTFGGNWSKHKRQFLQTHRCENVINNQNKWHSDNMTAERGWHFIDILTNWTLTRDLTELEIKQGHCSFPNKMISMQGVDACSNNFINETIQGFSDVN